MSAGECELARLVNFGRHVCCGVAIAQALATKCVVCTTDLGSGTCMLRGVVDIGGCVWSCGCPGAWRDTVARRVLGIAYRESWFAAGFWRVRSTAEIPRRRLRNLDPVCFPDGREQKAVYQSRDDTRRRQRKLYPGSCIPLCRLRWESGCRDIWRRQRKLDLFVLPNYFYC